MTLRRITFQTGNLLLTMAVLGLLEGLSNRGISWLCCTEGLTWVLKELVRFAVAAHGGLLLRPGDFCLMVWQTSQCLWHLVGLQPGAGIIASLLLGC
jgi:hypothetical protein